MKYLNAIKFEKDLAAISNHLGNEENKYSTSDNNGKRNKGTSKMDSYKKEKEPTDMDSMQRMIKQLTNEIIDLKNSTGEGKKSVNPHQEEDCHRYSPSDPSNIRNQFGRI